MAAYDPATPLAEEVTSRFGGRTARSADELIEGRDVDVVFVATPHHLHAQLAVQAARAGRHVLVEKPLAVDLEQALTVADAADRYGVAVSICLPYRYAPHVVEARRLIRDGALGTFAAASLVYLVDKPPSYWSSGYSGRAVSDWRGSREKAGGGVLLMNLSHYLDALRYLVDVEVESVSAHVSSVDQVPRIDVEDSVALTLRYENGAIAAVMGSAACRGASRLELAIWGEVGHISVESPSKAYSLRASGDVMAGRWRFLPTRSGVTDQRERMAFLDDFAAAVRDRRQPDVSVSDGIAVQALIEAAYRSSHERRPASPDDILREAEVRAGRRGPA
ncbi:MAG: Gfo/Idh/MocA family oxidoreductase [Actinobacteria bacterium]|nr:Gfo/Idh/MocA family oxidoreductase [Actinomycetota bacterium]